MELIVVSWLEADSTRRFISTSPLTQFLHAPSIWCMHKGSEESVLPILDVSAFVVTYSGCYFSSLSLLMLNGWGVVCGVSLEEEILAILGFSAVNVPLLILYWVIQAPRIEADIWHLCSTGCTSAPQAGTISSLLSRLPMELKSCFMIIPLVWN